MLSACGGDKNIKPVVNIPGAYRPVAVKPTDADNWGFELGTLAKWQRQGDAFPSPQSDNPAVGEDMWQRSVKPVRLGGDYWHGPYPIGYKGNYWFSTFDRSRPNGDRLQGTLTSEEFTISKPSIDFLISGGKDPARLTVQLWVKLRDGETSALRDGDFALADVALGTQNEMMRRQVWDVTKHVGKRARIRIVDQSDRGHINVDDFNFSDTAPAVHMVTVDGFSFSLDANAPVWGFADIHTHPMSNLGFGETFFFGSVDGPIEQALSGSADVGLHGPGGTGNLVGIIATVLTGLPLATAGSPLISFMEEGIGHRTDGYPTFDGWPNYRTKIHQQMYIDWIRRAYDGGQRILVALAVNNELLAAQFRRNDHPFDDVTTVERQIQATKQLVDRHMDWMEIAYSADDARRIIHSNKLAIVLGVEVDSLGNCRKEGDCTRAQVTSYLQHLYDIGVRQITPMHLTNNAFGSAAIYHDAFSILNAFVRHDYFEVEGGRSSGVQFRLEDEAAPEADLALSALFKSSFYDPPDYARMYRGQGFVNKYGVNRNLGYYLLDEMMRLGFLIDIDHMSQKMTNDVLARFAEHHYPPVSSHTGFRHLAWLRGDTVDIHKLPHESQKTPEQLERIWALGGIIAPIADQHDLQTWDDGRIVPNDCPGSSKTWAQAYLNAVDVMRGGGVAIGTDFNGLAGQPGPRFGTSACSGVRGDGGEDGREDDRRHLYMDRQEQGVRYQTPIKDHRQYRFAEWNEAGFAYSMEERNIWEGIAIWKAGLDPETAIPSPQFDVTRNMTKNYAKGLRAANFRKLESPLFFGGHTFAEQLAAYIAKNGLDRVEPEAKTRYRELERTRALVPLIQAILARWNAMEGGPNPPLERSTAGPIRDFDINLDGLAHYGLLPDFIQDLKNSGMNDEKLQPLMNSAEAYIQVWERIGH